MPYLFANWKMNEPPAGAFVDDSPFNTKDVVVFPDYLHIQKAIEAGLTTGGQWAVVPDFGSYTGDVSHPMLKEMGCSYVLCGHSERRKHHQETDVYIAEQVTSAKNVGLITVLCIGESGEERERGMTSEVLRKQLELIDDWEDLFIAYEPVWAIGSGHSATPEDIAEAVAIIRTCIPVAHLDDVTLLYGGSVNSSNLQEVLDVEHIEGVLVGGASLDVEEWQKMVKAAA